MVSMEAKRKTSFMVRDAREPRRIAAIRNLAKKQAAAARQPTREEIIDLAITLAGEEHDLGPPLVELFHWPASAAPCQDPRRLFMPVVEKFKKKAAETLRRHYQYYHALELRRKRGLRAHPRPRGWAWTQKPLKHAVPPPKGRPYFPPGQEYPTGASPPIPPALRASPNRPGRRETERLLCFAWLFDS